MSKVSFGNETFVFRDVILLLFIIWTVDGGFSSENKKSLGIALTSSAVAFVAIVITVFLVVSCKRNNGKETDSEAGLVPGARRAPTNEGILFQRAPRRQNMSALWCLGE